MNKIRINKFIANSGICSRRTADDLIEQGRVFINGTKANIGDSVDEQKDIVIVDGKKIYNDTNKLYVMLNKPVGYVTTSKEQFNRPCVLDLIHENVRLYPVGRLDMSTSGLLLLTNDGEFTNRVTHPKNYVKKLYKVQLKNEISAEDIIKLENGVDIGGYVTKPANVKKINNKNILMTISEGKNRQIRKMCESVGNEVVKLKRLQIGKLALDNLKEGEYRYIDKKELEKIFK